MAECPNCGIPLGLRAAHATEPYCVYVDWDDKHSSPPIGPVSRQEADKLATQIRKGLKKNKRRWQNTVHVRRMVEPDVAMTWESISGAGAPAVGADVTGVLPFRVCVADFQTPRSIHFSTDGQYIVQDPWRDFGVLRTSITKRDDGLIVLENITTPKEIPTQMLEWALTTKEEDRLSTFFITGSIVSATKGKCGDPIPWSLVLKTAGRYVINA